MEKHFSLLVTFLAVSLTCNAQLFSPEQVDTLIVKEIKYNKMKVDKENWPFKYIYRTPETFIFGDKTFKLIDLKSKKADSKENINFRLTEISSPDDIIYDLIYKEKSKDRVYIEFSGYDITCRNKKGGWYIEELDEMPAFMGGSISSFTRWVNSQLEYPEIAKNKGIEGRILLQFTIGTDGSVTEIEVLKSNDFSLELEAVRVVSCSPNWTPGKIGGKPVKVTFRFPVIFLMN